MKAPQNRLCGPPTEPPRIHPVSTDHNTSSVAARDRPPPTTTSPLLASLSQLPFSCLKVFPSQTMQNVRTLQTTAMMANKHDIERGHHHHTLQQYAPHYSSTVCTAHYSSIKRGHQHHTLQQYETWPPAPYTGSSMKRNCSIKSGHQHHTLQQQQYKKWCLHNL